MHLALYLLAWILLCSVVSFAQYGLDKRKARHAQRRIPEKTLLLTCLLGGWPGAMLGGKVFRHKTIKKSYRRMFFLAIAGNIAIIIGLAWVLWPMTQG